MPGARLLVTSLLLTACTPPTSAPSGTAPAASAASAAVSATGVPSATGAPGASASGDALDGGIEAEAPRPVCRPGERLRGEVEVPAAEGVLLSNATPDASVDRGYAELGPALQRQVGRLRCCYHEALQRAGTGELAGRMVFEVALGADGVVKSVSHLPSKSDINHPPMVSCLAATLREVSFPASRQKSETRLVVPLTFRPGEGR